ncbi:Callose synthase [Cynara cardunculus var. scolymus]|uniref:Callose synthase n=1 Tax=Cynara cardunculus var. scolymus TaxID=59895 RepID=A0A118JUH2_CYNCS|nr:Callose synthase [Cynara cardunculus var. scolymus]
MDSVTVKISAPQIKPLVEPTRNIMKIKRVQYAWHEFFPQVVVAAVTIISLILQWHDMLHNFTRFTLWTLKFGMLYFQLCAVVLLGPLIVWERCASAFGNIRTLTMLRSRFQSIPGAFSAYLLPTDRVKRKGFSLSKRFAELTRKGMIHENVTPNKRTEAAKFAQLWNELVCSFREEDFISDRKGCSTNFLLCLRPLGFIQNQNSNLAMN